VSAQAIRPSSAKLSRNVRQECANAVADEIIFTMSRRHPGILKSCVPLVTNAGGTRSPFTSGLAFSSYLSVID
jgi:hypothetical protein